MQAAAPLSDIVVVELGTSVAAPFGAQILAELGATVVKVENPDGGDDARRWGPPFVDGVSSLFNSINRNKRSVAVDLKDEGQRASLCAFIQDRADVVLQNLRPGLVESFGLDAVSLRANKPSLIYCTLGAFGAVGPLKSQPGYDPLMQACAGIMSVTGHEGDEPVRTGPSIVDQGAGMWAVIGIVSALFRRSFTGEGCEVSTSLYETAIGWMPMQIANFLGSGSVPRRMGSENSAVAPYKAFAVAGGFLVIAAGNDKMFARLADALRHPELIDDVRFASNPERVRHRNELNAIIADIVRPLSMKELQHRLTDVGVPCAPVLSLDQVVADPQFAAVGMLQAAPDRRLSSLGLPLQFDGARPALRSLAPALGEATSLVLGQTHTEDAPG